MSTDYDNELPLRLEEAFWRWTDRAAMEDLYKLSAHARPPEVTAGVREGRRRIDEICHDEWRRRFEPLHLALVTCLMSGELVATGYARPLTPTSRRVPIEPALFELLELDIVADEARHGDLTFIRVEISRPPRDAGTAVPPVPEPDEDAASSSRRHTLRHNSSYSWVAIREHEFLLTGGQCTIIKSLHRASITENPWVANKALLGEYSSSTIGGVFRRHRDPSWHELIEQRRGHSRLKL